ncbi:hypothetical protein SERLADRAFT_367262 [Serpula lacrymans var. lacrymans S7.9]|uniref:CxC5 like cysteine cluster associated with KDZ domain-containing protein n=1 Tax=Serpula lacrymans var. lacrymans (strain S7.9) TaxID=578457 RepID=F8NPK3_SERL9|nr:uncharacterized protein SERLADRAFT_367262 [Serpula lacrymans var. lacrymans S7.9]EGO27694.1 hypothetical protein SERLADRAFT_367262 [Serpula lacrymans var. lacrymans S7.9]
MSVFEPAVVKSLIKNLLPQNEKAVFENKWKTVFEWAANVVEYVDYIYKATKVHGNKKLASTTAPQNVKIDIPLYGPQFIPPTYFHLEKHQFQPTIKPELTYLKPLNITHLFFHENLEKCPACGVTDGVAWSGWTSTGPRDLHGLQVEETAALGYQLHCQVCKEQAADGTGFYKGNRNCNTGYCFATTSYVYWEKWEFWEIPYLYDLIFGLRPSTTSGGLSEHIKYIYLASIEHSQQAEGRQYIQTLTGACLSLDNMFKSASKATVADTSGGRINMKLMKGGLLSIINKQNEIVSWRLCLSQASAKIQETLDGLKLRYKKLGADLPEMIVADHCCHVQAAINVSMPGTQVVLDVFHFIMRKGGVWSAAATKVHADQLAHVKKGCLSRTHQDLQSDGSHIEGLHKGWNSLMRSFLSDIEMFTALGHDFVHRCNICISINSGNATPFIKSTYRSHHLQLISSIASQWNTLHHMPMASSPHH